VAVGDSHYGKHYLALFQGWEIVTQGEAIVFRGVTKPAILSNGDAVALLMPRMKD
jgi:hypothetical protein